MTNAIRKIIRRSRSASNYQPAPSKTHRTDVSSTAGALLKLLYLGTIAEARHLVANRRSAGIPLPAIRQYADALLIVFLVVDDGAGDQYDLAAGLLRGEGHAVAGIKGRPLTSCVLLRIHDRARSTPLVFAGLVARRVEVRPAFADKLRDAAASQLGRLPAQWRVTRASRSLSAFSHLLVQRATASGDIPRGSL